MNNEYLVSVIIPVYGTERYLSRCIESVISQTYTNLEIILVEDGSPDGCSAICDDYARKDSRIVVIHQENQGVSAARNTGLDNAHGDYFSFVDSDDELLPNAIEFLLNDIISFNADLASAVKSTIYSDGTIVNAYVDHKLTVYSGLDMLALSLEGDRQTNSACAKLFCRKKFSAIRFEVGKNVNEDGFYLFQCYTLRPRVVQHNESVYKYYIITNSNSRNVFSDKYFDMLYFCDRKKAIIKEAFPELRDKLLIMEVSTNLFFLEILCRSTDKKYKSATKASIELIKRHYKYFECKNAHERKMAWIVAHGLYPAYKRAIRFKLKLVGK